VDLKALSDDAIDRLLGDATEGDHTELMQETRVCTVDVPRQTSASEAMA
jgi:hypothetical protein